MINLIPKYELFSTFKQEYIRANTVHDYIALDKLFEDIYSSGYEFDFDELEIGSDEYFIGNITYHKTLEQFKYFLRNYRFTDTKQYNFILWCLLDNYEYRYEGWESKIVLLLEFKNSFKIDKLNKSKLSEFLTTLEKLGHKATQLQALLKNKQR